MKKNIINRVLLLIGASLIVMGLSLSCTKKQETIVTTPQNTSQNLETENQALQFDQNQRVPIEEEDAVLQAESLPSTPANNSLFLEDRDSLDIPADVLSEIHRALLVENYPRVLNLVENRDDDASTYYRGIAYFVMMQEDQKYSEAERSGYAQNAERILGDLSQNTQYRGLKARSLLWYAVTLQAQYAEFQPLKTAVASLYEVSRYPNARVYNDSIYYLGNVHAKLGWYGPARYYYKKVRDLNQNGDDSIYDYSDKVFYTTWEASEAGLARLRAYMDGTHKDYGKN